MKRKTARELLVESFRELALKKSIDKITVKDITSNCGYSSATFYRQFQDKYDLIAWDYANKTERVLNQIGRDDFEWRDALRETAIRYQNEKDYLSNLLLHTSGHDAFITFMTEINSRELTKFILKATGKKELDQKTEMYVRLYCMGTVCLSCEWILGKYQATPEELAEIYENSLPLPLQPLLVKETE